MDSKKDATIVRGMLVKGVSRAMLNRNQNLAEILSFITTELGRIFPEDNNTNQKLN